MYVADLRHSSPSLSDKLHALYNLRPHNKMELGFRPEFFELLRAFGDPHKCLPPTIHVAGTNGKGSTVAMLRAILESAGYKVHTYTSPHLIEFNERIYIAGNHITHEALEILIDRALALNAGRESTFFEITTAMAFAAFAENPADILLCETGLGGRLDCTNIIENPLLSIITTVSYDHTEFLGDTLEKIAREKAGIMKPGAPCVIGRQEHPEALHALQKIASEKGIETILYDRAPMPPVTPNLAGAHQLDNARGVLAALDTIKERFPITQEQIERGLKNIHWPARLQKCESTKILPGWEVWYDGGHNESGARVLAAQAQHWRAQDNLPLHIILGMKENKNANAFVSHLLPHAASITLIEVPDIRSVKTISITATAQAKNLQEALETVMKGAKGRILVCGSLYLAAPLAKALH